jgi:hypothetical protein
MIRRTGPIYLMLLFAASAFGAEKHPRPVYEVNQETDQLVMDPHSRAFAANAVDDKGKKTGRPDPVLAQYLQKKDVELVRRGVVSPDELAKLNFETENVASAGLR